MVTKGSGPTDALLRSSDELRALIASGGFNAHLPLELLSCDGELLSLNLTITEGHLRHPDHPDVHGGVITALIDLAATLVVLSRTSAASTAGLSVEFLRPVRGKQLTAEARVRRQGRRLAVVDVEVLDATSGLAALGRATLAIASDSSSR